jgi:hypothetical protein
VIKHNALGRWLLPGGQLEPADTGLLAAARRELAEETCRRLCPPSSLPTKSLGLQADPVGRAATQQALGLPPCRQAPLSECAGLRE